ncbi:hypothetical protein FAZ69_16705 [Trinickia terrae]|uniref:Uncharacterized protein n=1 Tax=Trinickia terrae TaxID=2571161 RepID=A0A4U1I3V7_9BURK|nr:hypothetical protein [Trinickia terrae]TKC87905.1 hypothetical protein FAZ69_16705 [Trinickia terrae]
MTANPKLIKEGAHNFDQGWKGSISGLGEAAGGVAGAAVGVTPLGAALNSMTHGAASRLASGVFEGAASTVKNGLTGAEKMADGIVHGNLSEIGKGALGVGQVAALAIPGLGEGDMALSVATTVGKNLIKDGVKDQVGSSLGLTDQQS